MKALVIGVSGFIGSHVARALLAAGHAVRGLRRPSSDAGALGGIEREIEPALGDTRDLSSLEAAARGCDWIFHAAGHYPTVDLDLAPVAERAVRTMRNVLEAARTAGAARVVYTSTLSTVGAPGGGRALADERDHYLPGSVRDAYFEAKWLMEAETWRHVAGGLPVVTVNPTICIGPHDAKPTSNRIVRDVAAGRLPVVLDGRANFVDVRDVAVGHVRAAERGEVGERYILGHENTTMAAFADRVAWIAGVRGRRFPVPGALAGAAALATEYLAKYVTGRPPLLPLEGVNMIRHGRHYDCSKAVRELGMPQSPVDGAIRDSIAWMRATNRLAPVPPGSAAGAP